MNNLIWLQRKQSDEKETRAWAGAIVDEPQSLMYIPIAEVDTHNTRILRLSVEDAAQRRTAAKTANALATVAQIVNVVATLAPGLDLLVLVGVSSDGS